MFTNVISNGHTPKYSARRSSSEMSLPLQWMRDFPPKKGVDVIRSPRSKEQEFTASALTDLISRDYPGLQGPTT